jgi:hypothetical protein
LQYVDGRRSRVREQGDTIRAAAKVGVLSNEPTKTVCVCELDVKTDAFTQCIAKDLRGIKGIAGYLVPDATIGGSAKIVV